MADDPRDPDEEIDENENEGEDAGLLDDEGGDEAEAGQEPEGAEAEEGAVDAEPERPARRGASETIRAAKNLARENAEKATRLEREIAELRAERERSKPQGETPEQEAARLSLMTAEERMDYKLAKSQREHERQIGLVRFESADRADKAAFDAKGAYDPRYKKYGGKVEELLAQARRNGDNPNRETVLKFYLGDLIMSNSKEVRRQQQNGKQNIARQATRPTNASSDRAAPRGRLGTGSTLADLEKRLEGVEI